MATYSEDRQVLVRKENGTFFQAAVTHKEKNGTHWVIVSAADTDLPNLRDGAGAILSFLAQQHGVRPEVIQYFERGRDGAVFAVDTRPFMAATIAPPAPAAPSPGLSQPPGSKPRRRGVWCDEADLVKRIGKVRLPQVDPALRLTPTLGPVPAPKQNQSAPSVQPAPRAQRPRLMRPK